MSLSHVFKQYKTLSDDQVNAIVDKVSKIVDYSERVGLIEYFDQNTHQPICDKNQIRFQSSSLGSETFSIKFKEGFVSTCKAKDVHYNAIVNACLLAVMSETTDLECKILSEGEIHPDQDWGNGYILYCRIIHGNAYQETILALDEDISDRHNLDREDSLEEGIKM